LGRGWDLCKGKVIAADGGEFFALLEG